MLPGLPFRRRTRPFVVSSSAAVQFANDAATPDTTRIPGQGCRLGAGTIVRQALCVFMRLAACHCVLHPALCLHFGSQPWMTRPHVSGREPRESGYNDRLPAVQKGTRARPRKAISILSFGVPIERLHLAIIITPSIAISPICHQPGCM